MPLFLLSGLSISPAAALSDSAPPAVNVGAGVSEEVPDDDRAILHRQPDALLLNSSSDRDRPLSRTAQVSPQFAFGGGLVPLAIVLFSILAGAWFIRRFLTKGRLGSSAAIKVLSRTCLSSKQSLVLVKIGKRVLLVGITPDHISPLADIDDPIEVDLLTAGAADSGAQREPFDGVLRDESAPYAPVDDLEESAARPHVRTVRKTRNDVRELLGKVRALTGAARSV